MDDVQSHRRWFRFSLRGLLVAITLVSVLFGWRINSVRKVDKALKSLEAAGFLVQRYWGDEKTMTAGPDDRTFWKRVFMGEGKFAVMNNVEGSSVKADDAGFRRAMPAVRALGTVRCIALVSDSISDRTLLELKTLPALKRIALWFTKTSEAGVADLQRALPDCYLDVQPTFPSP